MGDRLWADNQSRYVTIHQGNRLVWAISLWVDAK